MNYNGFQSQVSSEKITLAIVEASKRLIGFTVHSGSVYKLTGLSAVVSSIKESGSAYTKVDTVGEVAASKYHYDEDNSTLYVHTSDGSHPNGKFIVLVQSLHFSNVPIVLPRDLSTGEDVYFEPLVQSTSAFGVEIDTVNQLSEAIEGSGTLTLINDQEFWPANYDKLIFENQKCTIYSYNRDLDVSEAKKLFDGQVESRSYNDSRVVLRLKDQLSVLREPVQLTSIQALNARHEESMSFAKQRMILGRVFGHRPVNIDHERDGYPVTGTVSISSSSTTVTGSSTQFLKELSPDDELLIDGVRYVVASVTSDTSLELTEAYAASAAFSAGTVYVRADQPKRWYNRVWNIAGHALREPVAEIQNGSTTISLVVDSSDDFFAGDDIYVGTLGSGELVVVDEVLSPTAIKLSTSLASIPSAGVLVRRPCVQDVRINETKLVYYRDYTVDAETATLTLREDAEDNVGGVRQIGTNVTFTSGSRTVTGTGFETLLKPGYMLGRAGVSEYREILSIESDTSLTLRVSADAALDGTSKGRYKDLILSDDHVLSCDVLGRTADGTTTGTRDKTAPQIVKSLLVDLGKSDLIDEDSFTEADVLAPFELGFVLPQGVTDRTELTYREVINNMNKSVFGSLVQTNDFKFKYEVLQPSKPTGSLKLDEADCIDFSVDSTAKNMIKTVTVDYRYTEYDYETADVSRGLTEKTSDNATYLLKTGRIREFQTYLLNEIDSKIIAGRWAFLLEYSTGQITIDTKLQAARVEVGDIVDFTHRKLFERFGSTSKRKLMLVESVKKTGTGVRLECTDLSNAFNRVAVISDNTNTYADSDEDEKFYGGFITDEYGLIDNDEETYSQNLIW